jgi:hypothetical protein
LLLFSSFLCGSLSNLCSFNSWVLWESILLSFFGFDGFFLSFLFLLDNGKVLLESAKEVKALDAVKAKLHKMIDPPAPADDTEDASEKHAEPKPDLSAFKKNLSIIEKEEEAKEEAIEAKKA